MSDPEVSLEDVRTAFVTLYQEFYSKEESHQMFDAWLSDYTQKVQTRAFNRGFKKGFRIAERGMEKRYGS